MGMQQLSVFSVDLLPLKVQITSIISCNAGANKGAEKECLSKSCVCPLGMTKSKMSAKTCQPGLGMIT